jgi:three-Cys-motif partner protein
MNEFGGDWTKEKIEILIEYAKAYLEIMKKWDYFELLYFDGFAGSGFIIDDKDTVDKEITVGASKRILEISEPRPFDTYYFVEMDPKTFTQLEKNTKKAFPNLKIHTVCEDCNKKLCDLSDYLNNPQNKYVHTLAYIDPYGMQVEWSSIERLKGLKVDMWILVPTGIGPNRLLTQDGNISEAWIGKLEKFLGMKRDEIDRHYYDRSNTLFEDITAVQKKKNAIQKSAQLYKSKLETVFKYVSDGYELANKHNSIMYHLFLASNNKTAFNIANDIVKKYNR